MVRVNSIFFVKNEADAEQVKLIARQLIEKSRLEDGCISYDLFQASSTQTCLLLAASAHLQCNHRAEEGIVSIQTN